MFTAKRIPKLAILIGVLLAAACDGAPEAPPETGQPTVPEADETGARPASTDDLMSRAGQGIDVNTHPGNTLFADHCLICHDGRVPKAPATV